MNGLFSSQTASGLIAAWDRLCAGKLPADSGDPSIRVMRDLYGPLACPPKKPFVLAQLGQSLDGFIATPSGASHYITGPESLIHLHRLRALSDAVIVGWRTVDADNPRLNVRHVPGKDPLRVIIDIEGKLPATHAVFSRHAPGALRLTGKAVAPLANIESETINVIKGRADPKSVIALLADRGCKTILVEGGGALVTDFFQSGMLDRLHLAIAPLLLGEGRRGIALPAAAGLDHAPRLTGRQYEMGNDVLFDFDLR